MIYACCTDDRRAGVAAHPTLNGIDFLEVEADQRTLELHLLKPPATALVREAVRIEGGDRIRNVRVTDLLPTADDRVLRVEVDRAGDFSTYTLRLVGDVTDPDATEPPPGFDPVLAAVDFSFKAGCETGFDCGNRPCTCPLESVEAPEIDYLAKDYATFRQVILDRMATVVPDWTDRNPADIGVMLVELLAHVGDQLSYAQDAVATEAYIGTARRRVSVRRHARLVDYRMHDGRNARVWVRFEVGVDLLPVGGEPAVPRGTPLLTRVPGLRPGLVEGSPDLVAATAAHPEVFEVVAPLDAVLVDHNELRFHTWGAEDCCLPAGATRATLAGAHAGLEAGMVLVLQEVRGPETGESADADTRHRHAVLLTAVAAGTDPLTGDDVTEVAWGDDDALPFPLCISSPATAEPVAVAYGNVVLADHGASVGGHPEADELAPVPDPDPVLSVAGGGDHCDPQPRVLLPPRYRPVLRQAPITQAAPFAARSAAGAFRVDMAEVMPQVRLVDGDGVTWHPRRDLLSTDAARNFVVEVEDDGRAALRFGDGTYGTRPPSGTRFTAHYRVGNGRRGNVGAETIAHVVLGAGQAGEVRLVANPLPARGGTDPETIEDVRQRAPYAFRTQERAVTAEDYAAVARAFTVDGRPQVQAAQATFRWTGSWRTVFVTVDRFDGRDVDDDFRAALRAHYERYRMAGQDVQVDSPRYVPLELAFTVCVERGYFAEHVRQALVESFTNRTLFHPDRFTFGQAVHLSPFVAAAQAVDGVRSVEVTAFRRLGDPGRGGLDSGVLTFGRLEVARLDNDPDFPDRGSFVVTTKGGT